MIRKPFWDRVEKTDTCWLWRGPKHYQGYGVCTGADGRPVYVHRRSWEIRFGAIPEGMFVCHKCDIRLCLNPDHLFLGTQLDNIADAKAKGRTRNPRADAFRNATHCIHGHEFTPENTAWDKRRNWRSCRICRRAIDKRAYYKEKARRVS